MNTSTTQDAHAAFRELEAALSEPRFLGLPLGATLNDTFNTRFIDGLADLRRRTTWLRRALNVRHLLRPRLHRRPRTVLPPGRVLVTWSLPSHRYDGLLLPILERLGPDGSAVLSGYPGVAPLVPAGIPHVPYPELMVFDPGEWRREFSRCWPAWQRTLRDACDRLALPDGAFELLAHDLLIASQRTLGAMRFLEAQRPSAIVTEYDRNAQWAPLVLAARSVGIPSVTLVHGVMGPNAWSFSPVLANRILSWGELDREKLIAAGEPPSRVVVAGCPRLTRDLPAPSPEVRRAIGVERDGPVVLLATSPESIRFELAETFASAMERLPGVSGVVRLHPSEDLADYGALIARHPTVSFIENRRASVDDALAAVDVVVVRASGFGSDALVKRRPVVVLNPDPHPTGPDLDLIVQAGCPHARDAAELADVLGRMTGDPAFRAEREREAERYVARFCAAFGDASADLTVAAVRELAERGAERGAKLDT